MGRLPPEEFAAGLAFPPEEDPVVSVVIPARNNLPYTLCCLASLQRFPAAAPIEVVVVDDASTDATSAVLPLVANLVYVRNEAALGFGRTVNRAAGVARGRFLHLLNNDAQVRPGAIDALLAAFDDPAVGLAGSKLIFPSGHLQEAGAVIRADGMVEFVGPFDDPARPEYNVGREVDHCSGASVMVRRELFRELGGFDDAYAPAYFEDCDLSLRVRGRGLRVVYAPRSEVVHHLSVTTAGEGAAAKARQIEVNRRLLLERWGEVLRRRDQVRTVAFPTGNADPAARPGPFCARWSAETGVDRAALLPLFADPRYIRIDGRPLLVVDGDSRMADAGATVDGWRRICREASVAAPYLIVLEDTRSQTDPRQVGFDAALESPPRDGEYQRMAKRSAARRLPPYPLFRTLVAPADEARDGRVYERWREAAVRQTRHLRYGDERIVFLS